MSRTFSEHAAVAVMHRLLTALVVMALGTLLVSLWNLQRMPSRYEVYSRWVFSREVFSRNVSRDEVLPRDEVFSTTVSVPYVYRFSNFNSHFPGVLVSDVRVPCLPPGVATVYTAGRLGNLILEVVSLWTAARVHNLTAYVPAELRDPLEKVFEPMGVPVKEELLSHYGCPASTLDEAMQHLYKVDQDHKPLAELVSDSKDQQVPIVFEMCVILPETIVPMAAEMRRHFRYRQELRDYATESLRNIRDTVLRTDPTIQEVVFAGVHVRRTDYIEHLRFLYNSTRPADPRFYGIAALWLKSEVVPPGGELVLVVASDDPKWVREQLLPHLRSLGLNHSFMAGDGQLAAPERDLALLSACNHSVFAYGTYGLWSALAAGGRAAVFDLDHGDAVSPAMQFAQHMPGWVTFK